MSDASLLHRPCQISGSDGRTVGAVQRAQYL